MSATADQIAQLRRMVGETAQSTDYGELTLAGYIEAYPLLDERGEQPYTWDAATEPPTKTANTSWIPTYDLHAAAADIWEEKAATRADKYNFSADGGKYDRSQAYEMMMKRVRYHRARRSSKTMTAKQWPEENTGTSLGAFSWIGNLPETDDNL